MAMSGSSVGLKFFFSSLMINLNLREEGGFLKVAAVDAAGFFLV